MCTDTKYMYYVSHSILTQMMLLSIIKLMLSLDKERLGLNGYVVDKLL